MAVLLAVLATLAVVGFVVAIAFASDGPYWTEPNCGGCVLFMVAGFALLALAFMKLGAWIW